MTPTTADKGEQECREAFEQWVLESWDATHLRTDRVGTYVCLHIFLRWQAWKTAWNRRPTCEQQRTTNEGQGGLTDSIVDRIIEDAGIPHRGEYSYALAQAIARHLSSKQAAPDAWQKIAEGLAKERDAIKEAICWPDEWDSVCYDTLDSAMQELFAWFKVSKEIEAEDKQTDHIGEANKMVKADAVKMPEKWNE